MSSAEVAEVDDGRAVAAVKPALVYDVRGEACALPAGTVNTVDDFHGRNGYQKEAAVHVLASSLGVCAVLLDVDS